MIIQRVVLLSVCLTISNCISLPDIDDVLKISFKNAYPGQILGPQSYDDKILVIGAGVSGIHMGYILKQAGFKNVEIFERRNRLGGKSKSVAYRGSIHEMGTLYMTNDYQNTIIKLIRKFTNSSLTSPPLAAVKFRDQELLFSQYLGYFLKSKHPRESAYELSKRLSEKIMRYIDLHQDLFGFYVGEIMPKPSHGNMSRIRGSFHDFLKRNDLVDLVTIFEATMTVQGYGCLEDIPALYGLMWNTPKLMFSIAHMLKDGKPALYTVSNGFENLWKSIAQHANLRIQYNTDIRYIHLDDESRDYGGFKNKIFVYYETPETETIVKSFDFVIWSPPAKDILKVIGGKKDLSEEIEIFSRMPHTYYATSLVDQNKKVATSSPINWWFQNIHAKIDGNVWASRDTFAVANNYSGEAYAKGQTPKSYDGKEATTLVYYQYSKAYKSKRFMNSMLKTHLESHDVDWSRVVKYIPWRYFDRFDNECLQDGCHWKVLDLQGRNKIWFIGSSVSFESIKSVVEYNLLLLSRMKDIL